MQLIGLEYIGYIPSGVALVLFGGYKTVVIDALHPYQFTETDDTSEEALQYYESLDSDLFIKVIISDDSDNNEDGTENESELNNSG
jgi:hypothetical protein